MLLSTAISKKELPINKSLLSLIRFKSPAVLQAFICGLTATV